LRYVISERVTPFNDVMAAEVSRTRRQLSALDMVGIPVTDRWSPSTMRISDTCY